MSARAAMCCEVVREVQSHKWVAGVDSHSAFVEHAVTQAAIK